MNRWLHYGFLFLLLIVSNVLNAQTSKQGLYWGLRIGGYFANHTQADFYNGLHAEQSSLSSIIEQDYYYDKISEYYNDDFSLSNQTPIMKYIPTVAVGGLLHYYISSPTAVYIHASIVQLQSKGVFQIQLASPLQGTQFGNNTQQGTIRAKEQRFMFDFGLQHTFSSKNIYSPYVYAGATILSMQVVDHTFAIADVEGQFSYYNASSGNSYFSSFAYGPQLGIGIQVPVQNRTVFIGGEFDYIAFQHLTKIFSLQSKIMCKVEM